MQKEDVWDTRNVFKNVIRDIIFEENFQSETMHDLVNRVTQRVKEWIEKETPRLSIVDGPWKVYM